MHVSTRSYLTAGIAALSAGAVALAPIQPLSQGPAVAPELTKATVALAAAIDPITPIIETLMNTGANLSNLVNTWGADPLPILQQRLNNVGTFFGELPDLSLIVGQIVANFGNAFHAPSTVPSGCVELGGICDSINPAPFDPPLLPPPFDEVLPNRQALWGALPLVLGPEEWVDTYEALFTKLVTPISGLVVGLVGPVLAPLLSLTDSLGAAFTAFGNSDILGGINELINIPTNMINAFFNGGPVLNLTNLIKALGVTLPDSVSKIGITMGGLLSPGGVAFDALNVDASFDLGGGPLPISVPGLPVGPIGAIYTINQAIATAIKVTPPTTTSRVSASSVAAPDETAPEETPAVDSPEPLAVAFNAAPGDNEKAASPKRAASRQSEAKSADTGKSAASKSASRGRAASRN